MRRLPLSLTVGGLLVGLQLVLALAGPWVAPFDATQIATGPPLAGVSLRHPFGTDILGRDVFSRVLHGGHIVIGLAVSGTFIGVAAGAAIGLMSAYRGGWFDEVVMRLTEALISIPYLVLALLAITVAGPAYSGSPVLVVLVVGLVYAPRVARIARSTALDVVTSDYVTAAQLRGEKAWSIVLRELLPNCLGSLMVELAVRAGYAPVLIGALGFLGFGLRPPTSEWGLMMAEGRDFILASPMTVVGPGLMLSLLVIGMNLLTEGLSRVIGRTQRQVEA